MQPNCWMTGSVLPALQATLLSERLNGVGVVRQLELSFAGMDGVIAFTIASLVIAGLKPSKKLVGAPPEDPIESVQTIAGRLSFLGLAGTLAAEIITGKVSGSVAGQPLPGTSGAGQLGARHDVYAQADRRKKPQLFPCPENPAAIFLFPAGASVAP